MGGIAARDLLASGRERAVKDDPGGNLHRTASDAGCIRIHNQAGERPAAALMLANEFGDCENLVQIGESRPHGPDTPPLHLIEDLEFLALAAGAWLSDHDCRNGYISAIPPGRDRVHRTDAAAPACWWLERVGTTTPRSAYAMVRSPRRGWALALYAPLPEPGKIDVRYCTAGWCAHGCNIGTCPKGSWKLHDVRFEDETLKFRWKKATYAYTREGARLKGLLRGRFTADMKRVRD